MDDVTPESYITSDDAVETTEELTTENIVAQVQSQRDNEEPIEDEDDYIEELPDPVTLAEAECCVDKLRRFFQAKEATHDFYDMLDQMESFTSKLRVSYKQTVISDYFSKI